MSQNDSLKVEKPQSLEEKVYFHLKRLILSGVLPPGVITTETDLAEKLGVSRTPVRKTLARLEQEGFITNIQPKGYQVVEISSKDVRDIYELREILECHMVRETAKQLMPEDLAEMESALQAADQCLENGDYPGYVEYSRAFHHVLDRKHGNKWISGVLANLDEHVHRFWVSHLKSGRAAALLSHSNPHRLILEAIQEGDIESAVARTREHMRLYLELGGG
jgi:DNA-binding GntR family transcriptional regulator